MHSSGTIKMSDNRNNKKQKGLAAFFRSATKSVSPIPPETHGRVTIYTCRYCRQKFNAQGWKTHERSCEYNTDDNVPHRKPQFGRAKVREEPSSQSSPSIAGTVHNSIVENVRQNNISTSEAAETINPNPSSLDMLETDGEDDEYFPESALAPKTTKLTVAQKLQHIEHYDNSSKPTYGATAEWGRKEFNRQSLSRQSVVKIINKREEIQAKSQSRSDPVKLAPRQGSSACLGQYPEMENQLAKRIEDCRSDGVPYETWMLAFDAKDILESVNANSALSFKASKGWQRNFLNRFHLSLRKTTSISLAGPMRRETTATILEFLRSAQSFQMQAFNDSMWGVDHGKSLLVVDMVGKISSSNSITGLVGTSIQQVAKKSVGHFDALSILSHSESNVINVSCPKQFGAVKRLLLHSLKPKRKSTAVVVKSWEEFLELVLQKHSMTDGLPFSKSNPTLSWGCEQCSSFICQMRNQLRKESLAILCGL